MSDVEVLRRSGLESIEATLAVSLLHWTGHVIRIEDSRIPKMQLYEEIASGSRKVGGQKLRYKDVIKRHLKAMDISTIGWEELAADRSEWRSDVRRGKENIAA